LFGLNNCSVHPDYLETPKVSGGTKMSYLLQFCGVTDPLRLFYLEQHGATSDAAVARRGPSFGGFRPFRLDDLLAWALETARGRHWDGDAIQRTVVDVWMERAEAIRQWQLRLREEPADRVLVAAIGTQHDWEQRCEDLLHA
jgi:hypothetical protein